MISESEKVAALRKIAEDAAELAWYRSREGLIHELLRACECLDGMEDGQRPSERQYWAIQSAYCEAAVWQFNNQRSAR